MNTKHIDTATDDSENERQIIYKKIHKLPLTLKLVPIEATNKVTMLVCPESQKGLQLLKH